MASGERLAAAGLGRALTTEAVSQVAADVGVCVRPVLRRVTDRQTGAVEQVTLPCGSTRESVCGPCAAKARRLRMQQCAEGWHLEEDPLEDDQPDSDADGDDDDHDDGPDPEGTSRRVRSTRRRQDAVDLPRVPVEDRSVGRAFTAPDGTTYRPSMFVTLTLGSYGPDRARAPAPRRGRAATTIGGQRWRRCTSRSCSTGGCRTCAGAPATGCSTSARSSRSAGWPRTSTWRSAERSRGG